VQVFISKLFQIVLPLDDAPKLCLQKPSHKYFLPLVEHTVVGLPHSIRKLFIAEFNYLETVWGTSHVQSIIVLIIGIILIIAILYTVSPVGHPCDISVGQFHCRPNSYLLEGNGGSSMFTHKSSGGVMLDDVHTTTG
jgi:hypothetical protein